MTATIMIVEDEADLAEMLRYNLEAEGFRVLSAASGDEAAEPPLLRSIAGISAALRNTG